MPKQTAETRLRKAIQPDKLSTAFKGDCDGMYARMLFGWPRAERRHTLSREDIRRDALGQRLDAHQTQTLIDGFVRVGWLREVWHQKSGPGRPARRWILNPQLWEDS